MVGLRTGCGGDRLTKGIIKLFVHGIPAIGAEMGGGCLEGYYWM